MTDADLAEGDPGGGAAAGGGLGPVQRETIGLLVILLVVGYLLISWTQAYDLARPDPEFSGDGLNWEAFLTTASIYANFQVAAVMVVGFILVTGRGYQESTGAARLAAFILFPIGIVIALGASYAAFRYLTASYDAAEVGLRLFTEPSWPSRIGAASSFAVTAVLTMYLAWLSYVRLPISQRPIDVDDEVVAADETAADDDE